MLQDIHEQTGILADELAAAPQVPEETSYLWRWFCDISSGRQGGMGPNPLMHGEIDVWFRQRRLVPDEWELDAIRALDNAYLGSLNDETAGQIGSARGMGSG